MAQARLSPASRRCCMAAASKSVPNARLRYSIRTQGPGMSCSDAFGSTARKVPAMMREPWRNARQAVVRTQRARNRVLHDRVRFMQSGIPIRIERERSADHLARFLVILGADN